MNLLESELSKKFFTEALDKYKKYKLELDHKMKIYKVKDEFQLLCNRASTFSNVYEKSRDNPKRERMHQEISQWYRTWVNNEFPQSKTDENEEELKAKARAYYMIAVREANSLLSKRKADRNNVGLSFACLGGFYLGKVLDDWTIWALFIPNYDKIRLFFKNIKSR